MPELRIRTNVYSGPMDLLFFLVRRAEVDVFDLPVAEIADQYITELEKMERVDLHFAGEYLVLAAQLVKLKSEMVLHQADMAKGGEDPRTSLVKQLLEYKRFRDIAAALSDMQADQLRRHPRPSGQIPVLQEPGEYLEEATVYDLYREHFRLVREITPSQPHAVLLDEVPIEEYIRRILHQLLRHGSVDFATLFAIGGHDDAGDGNMVQSPAGELSRRLAAIGNFLAILELVKSQQVDVEQQGSVIKILPKTEPATASIDDETR